jgi:biotin synthase-like enzyme
MDAIVAMVQGVNALGVETCVTPGTLSPGQAKTLAAA